MKRICKSVVMALFAISMSFSMTSCGNEELMNILGDLLVSYLNSAQGKSYTFTGTATECYAMVSLDGGNNYKYIDDNNRNNTVSMTLPVKIANNSAQIDFPSVTVNGITFPATTVANLDAKINSTQTGINIEVGNNTTANGILVIDGVSYEICNMVTDNLNFTTDENSNQSSFSSKQIQLWYGTPETKIYVINYKFNGVSK